MERKCPRSPGGAAPCLQSLTRTFPFRIGANCFSWRADIAEWQKGRSHKGNTSVPGPAAPLPAPSLCGRILPQSLSLFSSPKPLSKAAGQVPSHLEAAEPLLGCSSLPLAEPIASGAPISPGEGRGGEGAWAALNSGRRRRAPKAALALILNFPVAARAGLTVPCLGCWVCLVFFSLRGSYYLSVTVPNFPRFYLRSFNVTCF